MSLLTRYVVWFCNRCRQRLRRCQCQPPVKNTVQEATAKLECGHKVPDGLDAVFHAQYHLTVQCGECAKIPHSGRKQHQDE
jgi:hypothetical protein